jgi:hypothetical protein
MRTLLVVLFAKQSYCICTAPIRNIKLPTVKAIVILEVGPIYNPVKYMWRTTS